MLDVVKRYQGDFVNQKEGGKDVGFFMFPKPKPKDEVKPAADPAPPAAAVTQEKPVEVPKQPSPVTQFTGDFCSMCEDASKCDVSAEGGRFHRAMCLQLLDLQQITALNVNLEKLRRVIGSQPAQAASPAAAPAPSSEKVERNTRPTEGHKEGDVVWIYAENQQGERYEKVLDKDNARSNGYYDIRGKIQAAEKAGKKGVVIDGKWCWLSKQGDFIGRKIAKEFPTGGSR